MRITSSEFLSKYFNGDDFTSAPSDFSTNAVGVVQETKQLKQIVEIDVSSYANYGANFDVQSNRITRLAGNFKADGFSIGDEFTASYTPLGGSNIQFTATITDITSQRIDFTNKVDTVGTYADANTDNFRLYLLSDLTGFKMNYNFIENSDSINYSNFIDGTQMGWYADNVGTGGTRSTAWVDATELGNNKSWYNGSLRVRYIENVGHIQKFEIEHTFVILPFYQDSELTNIQTGTPPVYFFGGASLKYISKLDFRRVLSNPNSSKIVKYENTLGSIGWFNEPFNGFSMPFSIQNVFYLDSTYAMATTIKVDDTTTVTCQIKSTDASFSATTLVGVHVAFLPDLTEYQDAGNTFRENFLFDTVYSVADGTTTTPASANQIKNVTIQYIDANTIAVDFEVKFTDSRLSNISNFLLSCEVASAGGTNAVNDKTNLIIDTNTFDKSNDIADLFGVDFQKFELFDDTINSNSFTDVKGWVEDTINLNFECWLDLSKNAYLNNLDLKIVAYNPTTKDYFELQNINIPLSGVVVSGTQIFNTDIARGFNFPTKNDYNIIKFQNKTTVGSKVYYEGFVAIKFDWQGWLSLPLADTVFYDATKPNNGLNKNISNYSLKNGYEIRTFISADVNETVLDVDTIYNNSSPTLEVYDYDLDGNVTPVWSGSIETFDSTGYNLSGGLLDTGATTIKATFNTTGTLKTAGDYKAEISLNPENSTTQNSIKLFLASITISGSDLIAEITVNPSDFVSGVKHNISSRLRDIEQIMPCGITLVLDNITSVSPNEDSYDITTNAVLTTPASIIIKQNDGTVRETLTRNVGDNIASFNSDLSNTPVSITGFCSGLVQNGHTILFDKVAYKNGMAWWGENTEDSIIFEYTIDCKTESIKIYI